jgi:hypothetical protein
MQYKGRCPEFHLKLFDLRRISGYKKGEVTGGWRKYIIRRLM